MKFLSARGILPACIISAATVVACVLPSAASATLGAQCSGSAVKGQGSTLQEEAEILWAEDFNTSGNVHACKGSVTSTVKYVGTGSGAGLRSWDGELHGSPPKSEYKGPEAENAFLGTDEPPNSEQIEKIESEDSLGIQSPRAEVETVPVLEGAVAIIVNLPEGCVATSKSNKGRLVFNDSTLEGIYRGTVKKWSEVKENADKVSAFAKKIVKVKTTIHSKAATVASGGFPEVEVGMKVTGTGIATGTTVEALGPGAEEITLSKEATKTGEVTLTFTSVKCNPEAAIIPIVRRDGSGTTHIFKRYLNLINSATFKDEAGNTVTWGAISEGGANTQWPEGVVTKETGEGSPSMVTTVAATPSSIAYVNLADARSNGDFSKKADDGGPNFPKFWAPLQNKEGEESYADPASNKDVEAKASANCAGEEYSNTNSKGEAEPFPPPSVFEPWDGVTTKLTEKGYTLCGFTYVVSLHHYGDFTTPLPTLTEATTVNNYLNFVLSTTSTAGKQGGQVLIKSRDYLGLPAGEILVIAQGGAARVEF